MLKSLIWHRLHPMRALLVQARRIMLCPSSVLLSAEYKVSFVPCALEADGGVKYGQTCSGDDDHGAFHDHEKRFVGYK